ncbi:MAG: hypothetical protein KGY99_03540 [Phycisphaerae bacterium]|nr:hypothetical protein [Phycisphaerae bacterium]
MKRTRAVQTGLAVLMLLLSTGGAAAQVPTGAGATDGYDPLVGMSREEIDALLDEAAAARLKMERDAVAAEIRGGLLYAPDAKDEAVAILGDADIDTQLDNIACICRAFAAVDDAFAEVYADATGDTPADALPKLRKMLKVHDRDTDYRSAALHYLAAECLRRTDSHYLAVTTYKKIMEQMRDRTSFSSMSVVQAAKTQEAAGRLYYAAVLYAHCLNNYGLTLSKAEYDRIYARAKELADIYADPLGALTERMGTVRQRLAATDSGPETRKTQDEIVGVLTDLIKLAEEQGGRSGRSGRKQKPGNKGKNGKTGEEGKPGRAVAGVPRGTPARPSRPADSSFLPAGTAERPPEMSDPLPGDGAEDWAQLPPEQRERIMEAMRKLYPEKYRTLIKEYRKAMSEAEDTP